MKTFTRSTNYIIATFTPAGKRQLRRNPQVGKQWEHKKPEKSRANGFLFFFFRYFIVAERENSIFVPFFLSCWTADARRSVYREPKAFS